MPKSFTGTPDEYGAYYPSATEADDFDGIADPPADVSDFVSRQG